jgi:mannose-1-phosphate guanylyltransferase
VVVLMAADHHVERELLLRGSILEGVAIVRADPGRVVLLGVAPEEVEDSDFGWIVPNPNYLSFEPARVEGFHEKPDAAAAASLRARGALVSSFLLVARGVTLRRLFEQHLPDLAGPFARWRGRWGSLVRLYERIPSRDLSRDLLERSVDRLWVVPIPPCGWSDLGTPERVARCLESHRVPYSPAPTLLGPRPGFVAPLDLSRQLVGAAGS